MRKIFIRSGIALMLMIGFSAVCYAGTFTTEDGILSIDTPDDEGWGRAFTPASEFSISNGKDTISISHLSNAEGIHKENIPSVTVANSVNKGVYQAFVSTENEIFVVKALASDKANLRSLMEITSTIKVLKNDTGKENENAEPDGKKPLADGFEAYDVNGNARGRLGPYSDGFYYSSDMQQYKGNGDGSYYGVNTRDTVFDFTSGTQPQELFDLPVSSYTSYIWFQVWDAYGNLRDYLIQYAGDDTYYWHDTLRYVSNGDGSYYGIDTGDTLYNYYTGEYQTDTVFQTDSVEEMYGADVSEMYYCQLEELETGAVVTVTAEQPDSYVWIDAGGTEYQDNGDGTFTDYYGNQYNLIG